ncbi:MAG: SIMPL domain-containing protein [Fimbriimonadaceae bacterium]|nr:SIMPL domain-containing protein [Chitinophagales bacterium]
MRTITTIVLCISVHLLFAQSAGNQKLNDMTRWNSMDKAPETVALIANLNEMSFHVNVLMNVKADAYVAVFSISQVGQTLVETDNLSSRRINGFINSLQSIGIDTADIFTDMISLAPVYDIEVDKKLFSETYNEKPVGFEIQKNVHITFRNSELLDKIITASVQNEIYDLIKVDYFVNDTKQAYITMETEAVKYLNEKIKGYEALGIELDTTHKVIADAQRAIYPLERYATYQTFSRPSIDAARKRTFMNNDVKVVPSPRITTLYYNPLPYDNYDIVLNPVVSEPVVQFSYTLSIKYTIKDPVPKVIKQYYILTPDGKVQLLDMK